MTTSTTISRLYTSQIANGQLVDATYLGGEYDQLVTANNNQHTDIDNILNNVLTFASQKTFSGLVIFTNASGIKTDKVQEYTTGAGISLANMYYCVLTSDPGTPTTGAQWYNSTEDAFCVRTASTTFRPVNANGLAIPKLPNFGSVPIYASATTFTVATINRKDTGLVYDIQKTTSTTVDLSTTGLNGIAQSSTLTGTCGTGGASLTTITGSGTAFLTDFKVDDIIFPTGGTGRRITAIASNTSLTVESVITIANGTAFKRGGLAKSASYNVYATMTDTRTVPGLLLSPRNVAGGDTLTDFPSTYGTYYRQLPFAVTTDASTNLIPFLVLDWGSTSPLVEYMYAEDAAPYNIVSNGSTTTAFSNPGGGATAECFPLIPRISQYGKFAAKALWNSASGNVLVKNPSSTSTTGITVGSQNGTNNQQWNEFWSTVNNQASITTTAANSQQISWRTSNSGNRVELNCYAFRVTGIAS
jgi:hypothetical protein